VKRFSWIITAALSAYACQLAVQHATPIDRALPLLAVAVTVCAALSYPAVMVGVPLLVVIEVCVFDENARLLALGMVVAVAVAATLRAFGAQNPAILSEGGWLVGSEGPPAVHGERAAAKSDSFHRTPYIVAVAIVLLRWIPLSEVLVFRELFLLGLCLGIVVALGRTPFAVMIAVVTALMTPAIPLRTLAVPLLVLGVAVAARVFGMPRFELRWPSAVVVAFVMLFFAWSGILARAFPYFLRRVKPELPRNVIAMAVAPAKSLTLNVPENATSLIVSGANVAHFRRGALLGRIEPGGIAVRIGDAADWGVLRRDQAYNAHNPLPRDPAGKIRGYGYNAWLDGAGRVALPKAARAITVTADASLPPNATLQVEGFE
jgi:hypothetical protein